MTPRRTQAVPRDDATQKRIRRTDDELIRDLQAKIEDLKARATAKSLKTSPAIKISLKALRALDRAGDAAAAAGDSVLRHALADARMPLASHLEGQGLRIPKARRPKGPRPRLALD